MEKCIEFEEEKNKIARKTINFDCWIKIFRINEHKTSESVRCIVDRELNSA